MRSAIEMARESHLDVYGLGKDHAKFVDTLKRFEALVRADEREACAKVCEEEALLWPPSRDFKLCAAAIRARGQALAAQQEPVSITQIAESHGRRVGNLWHFDDLALSIFASKAISLYSHQHSLHLCNLWRSTRPISKNGKATMML